MVSCEDLKLSNSAQKFINQKSAENPKWRPFKVKNLKWDIFSMRQRSTVILIALPTFRNFRFENCLYMTSKSTYSVCLPVNCALALQLQNNSHYRLLKNIVDVRHHKQLLILNHATSRLLTFKHALTSHCIKKHTAPTTARLIQSLSSAVCFPFPTWHLITSGYTSSIAFTPAAPRKGNRT